MGWFSLLIVPWSVTRRFPRGRGEQIQVAGVLDVVHVGEKRLFGFRCIVMNTVGYRIIVSYLHGWALWIQNGAECTTQTQTRERGSTKFGAEYIDINPRPVHKPQPSSTCDCGNVSQTDRRARNKEKKTAHISAKAFVVVDRTILELCSAHVGCTYLSEENLQHTLHIPQVPHGSLEKYHSVDPLKHLRRY